MINYFWGEAHVLSPLTWFFVSLGVSVAWGNSRWAIAPWCSRCTTCRSRGGEVISTWLITCEGRLMGWVLDCGMCRIGGISSHWPCTFDLALVLSEKQCAINYINQSIINQSINHQSIINRSINHQSINHQPINQQSVINQECAWAPRATWPLINYSQLENPSTITSSFRAHTPLRVARTNETKRFPGCPPPNLRYI